MHKGLIARIPHSHRTRRLICGNIFYALCGFANFASIGIQIGGMASLAPSRGHALARLGFKSMVGGALATFMIACVAGIFYQGHSTLGVGQ